MRAERSAILLRRVTCEAAGPAWTCPPEAARATQEVLLDDSAPGSPPGPARPADTLQGPLSLPVRTDGDDLGPALSWRATRA